MEFVRRPGFHLKTKPQIVGEVCHSLEQKGKLTPRALVDASRDVNAPLHKEFEWRDGVAAEKYREFQAGYIINSIAVKITSKPQEVTRLNVAITERKNESVRFYHALERDGSGYENLVTINDDEIKRNKLLDLCIKDIKNFQDKYMTLRNELPKLFDAIEEELKRRKAG